MVLQQESSQSTKNKNVGIFRPFFRSFERINSYPTKYGWITCASDQFMLKMVDEGKPNFGT
jgi:hypothetical protein